MDPQLERIYVNLIKAALALGMNPKLVAQRFGVSKSFLRKKCGWRPRAATHRM